jgi:type II secretory pathway component PulK
MIVEWKNSSKENETGQLTIKNYIFERADNFKYLGVILNEDNNHKIDLQERRINSNKTYFMLQKLLEIKIYLKKLKFRLKNTITDKTLNTCVRNVDTNKER